VGRANRNDLLWRGSALGALGIATACGARSSLSLEASFQSETNAGTGAATGGSFAVGGAPSTAGTFAISGTGSSGSGSAGEPGQMCTLSTSDCRTDSQTECALTHPLCEGKVTYFNHVSSLSQAHIVDVVTSNDGRVAVAGYFEGALRSDSNVDSAGNPMLAASDGVDAFVASFDERGSIAWSWSFGGAGAQQATGIDFAPNGDLVVQGSSTLPPLAFVARLDAHGKQLWSDLFGADKTFPGRVAIDNNGDTTLVGGFEGTFEYAGSVLSDPGLLSYLLRLDADGQVVSVRAHVPAGWQTAIAIQVVADDEDNLIIAGEGFRGVTRASFVEKLTPAGETLFTQLVRGTSTGYLRCLAVDREMRVVLGGEFTGGLLLGETTVPSLPRQAQNIWIAQLGRTGSVSWARTYTDDNPRLWVSAIATDALGNIVFSGGTDKTIYVQKLRPNGDPVWLHHYAAKASGEQGLAADNAGNLWFGGTFADSFDWGDDATQARGLRDAFLLELSP